jgi:hypothetical protein
VSAFDYANIGRGGYVTAVSSTSVTVEQWIGATTTYAITPTTTFTEGKSATTISSLVMGDRVNVKTASSDPTTAVSINIELAELFGKVTAVSGDNITIMGPQGFSRTIVVSSATTYTEGGAAGTLADVMVGSIILAQGTIDANQTSLDALSIAVGTSDHKETIHGVVTAFTSSSVTVQSHDGTLTTFTFTTTTTFKDGSITLSAADLAVGQKVGVRVDTAAATTALNVDIQLAHLEGKVTAVSSDTITVAGPQGFSRVIDVSSTTTYTEHGAAATFADVVVGVRVRAEGTIAADQMSLNAIKVDIHRPKVSTPTPQPQNNGGSGKLGNHDFGGRGRNRK